MEKKTVEFFSVFAENFLKKLDKTEKKSLTTQGLFCMI